MSKGFETNVVKLRKRVFVEIARVAYETTNLVGDIEAIPYRIIPTEVAQYRGSVYLERAIASERVRLAMGMCLNPQDRPAHITNGLEESNISDKYYEPPLIQVIPSACAKCEENTFVVTDMCKSCVARYCVNICPTGAVFVANDTRAEIDQSKCIKCAKCKASCPYEAIVHKIRPCAQACGVNAIKNDALGRARIDTDICVACGQCMTSCPFGAIADKSQFFQLIQAIKKGDKVVAAVAPAVAGQFGEAVTLPKLKTALARLGFSGVYEVAEGADIEAVTEAEHFVREVATGKVPFLLTSCCPSWSMLAKKQFPEIIDRISRTLTPMVATARMIKQKHPKARVVFIGPCMAKKLEAMRRAVRSDVDFVITFEELTAMFEARGIRLEDCEGSALENAATRAGRGYAVAGGVAEAVESCIKAYHPNIAVKIERAEGLRDCKKLLALAKAGKKSGCLIEGMACAGGCVGGVGVNLTVEKGTAAVSKFAGESAKKVPSQDLSELKLP